MSRGSYSNILTLAILSAAASPAAPDLRLVHRVALSTFVKPIRSTLGPVEDLVSGLAFSPDERLLAIAEDFRDTPTGPVTNLVVLDMETSISIFQKAVPSGSVALLDWSSDGKYILLQSFQGSWLFDYKNDSFCRTGDPSRLAVGFVSDRIFGVATTTTGSTALRYFDDHCKQIAETTFPYEAQSIAVSAKAKLMAVSSAWNDASILSVSDWEQKGTIPHSAGLTIRTLAGGTLICGGPRPQEGDATFRCWKIDLPHPGLASAWPSKNAGTYSDASASAAPVVAFMDTGFSYNRFTEHRSYTFRRWVMWRADTGVIVGELPAEEQLMRFGDKGHGVKFPYASALSNDGRMFAVGGAGVVEIYAVDSISGANGSKEQGRVN